MKIWKYQFWHFLLLAILLIFIYWFTNQDPNLLSGSLWSINTLYWFIAAIMIPILHQVYVLICWRFELHYQGLSKLLGNNAFKIYKVGFAILILSRPVLVTLLAVSNANTFNINPFIAYLFSFILLVPAIYLLYSVKKYFGANRAMGIDHFNPTAFKDKPYVKKGIFKYTNNGMYIFGFLLLWVPAIFFQSKAALLVALFSHIYIWIHYYCTELPDMKFIYNKT